MNATLAHWQPHFLSALRIISALLFLQHGTQKLLAFPAAPSMTIATFSLPWVAGAIELVGGVLLALGLFTRWTAFVCSGLMAFAYFIAHAPRGFYPLLNQGELAIMYCFVFLYIFFAGPGPWSADAMRSRS